jgi:hypothetical protein
MNFNIGDTVRFADTEDNRNDAGYLGSYTIGDYAVITRYGQFPDIYYVDDCTAPFKGSFRFEKVEQIEEEPFEGDYIIVAIDDGTYAPAETPRVFDSEHQALVVAEKMAKEYDAEFAVFKRVAVLSPEGAEFDEADAVIGGIDFDIVDGAIIWDNDATF